jgi:plastocyanin
MSVIWFNDDQSEHSVAVNATNSDMPPEAVFDSDLIDPNGGSFIHKFTIPGTYDYYDSMNRLSKSSIKMGSEFEGGQNMTC